MDTPIIIIGFNNYTYIKQMIEQLQKYKLNNIIIIDNNSSYKKLLDYYDFIMDTVKIIKMNQNYGYMVLFNEIMADFYISLPNYFILTDPDIEFNENLPKNFIHVLINLTEKHKMGKVGFALDIDINKDDLKETYVKQKFRRVNIIEWENKYWAKHIYDDIYRADICTTFAVYNKSYFDYKIHRHFLKAFRIAGNFTAKHLQWYKSKDPPEYEKLYYFANTRGIFWDQNIKILKY